jgi:FkbM family methyltransferase
LLVALGLGRGALRHKIVQSWQRRFGSQVDVMVRRVKYRLNLQDNVTDRHILASSKIYDGTEIGALRNACREGAFVDVGANIGYYSLALAACGVAPIIAIEPNPPALARLRYNVSINPFGRAITILPIGIGEEGSFELHSSGDLGSASLLADPSSRTVSITIPTRPLWDVLQQQKIERIGGMKVDIEGMEDRALLPFFRDAPPARWPACVVVEHCHRSSWETDAIAHMLASGYVKQHETRGNTVLVREL